jgi:hypothetical protein
MMSTSGLVTGRSARVPTTVPPALSTRADAAVSAASAPMNAERGLTRSNAVNALRSERVTARVSAA